MDLDGLQLFIEVARRGGFAAVARDRDLDPSAVLRAIAVMEARLGFRLFQRTTRRLALTEAGALYLSRVEGVVEELDRARDEARAITQTPTGVLRLTTTVAFGQTKIIPLLPDLRAALPKVKLDLIFADANLDLVGERIDLAIRLGPSPRADVIAVRLFDTIYRVCASPGYVAREGRPETPLDLALHRCLLFPLPDFRARWLFRSGDGVAIEVPVDGDLVISTALGLRAAALAGLGPVLLGDWLIDRDIAAGRLVDLFPDHRVAATGFETAAWLLYPSRAYLPRKTRAVAEFLRARLKDTSASPPWVEA